MSIDVDAYRRPDRAVEPLIYRRWSPRAMSGEAIAERELEALFEAARWAPSCFNEQPWRFLFARRDTHHWNTFFPLMVEGNQRWARNAAVLIVVVSRRIFERNGSPSRTHSFDSGAAWQCLALQGSALGLVVHGMAGFDYEAARERLEIPDDYRVEAMIAVGRPGRSEDLDESLLGTRTSFGPTPGEQLCVRGQRRRACAETPARGADMFPVAPALQATPWRGACSTAR